MNSVYLNGCSGENIAKAETRNQTTEICRDVSSSPTKVKILSSVRTIVLTLCMKGLP